MEDLFSGTSKFVVRVVGYVLLEFFFQTVCYYTGWLILKLITLGKHPVTGSSDETICSVLGFFAILLGGLFVGWFF